MTDIPASAILLARFAIEFLVRFPFRVHASSPGDVLVRLAQRYVERAGEDVLPPRDTDNNSRVRIWIPRPGEPIRVLHMAENPAIRARAQIVLTQVKNICASRPIYGEFVFDLEDGPYTPQPGCFVLSKTSPDVPGILVPDIYALDPHGVCSHDAPRDVCTWKSKRDEAFFIGASTGSIDPRENHRLEACRFARTAVDCKCYLSVVAQMSPEEIARTYPSFRLWIRSSMSVAQQLQYRYLLDLDGNTCGWGRMPWIFRSNSICLKQIRSDVQWFYPLLFDGVQYIGFRDWREFPDKLRALRRSPALRRAVRRSAQYFYHNYLRQSVQCDFLANILWLKRGKTSGDHNPNSFPIWHSNV